MVKGWILLEKQIVNLEPSHYKQLFFLIFYFLSATCGIFTPCLRIEPMLPALESQSLYHWTTREVPQ